MRRTTVESAVIPGGEGASSGSRDWFSITGAGNGTSGVTARSAVQTVDSVLESTVVDDVAHIIGAWPAGAWCSWQGDVE